MSKYRKMIQMLNEAVQKMPDKSGALSFNDKKPIEVFHSSPREIQGEFKDSTKDVGVHFAKTKELAENAGIKGTMYTNNQFDDMITQKFNLFVNDDEIVNIKSQGNRFDFYDILGDLVENKKISQNTFEKTFDALQDIEKNYAGDINEIMQRQNQLFAKNLNDEGIKVLKYFNEFDAGPNFREIENVQSEEEFANLINNPKVKPDDSFIVLDKNVIREAE